MDTSQRLRVLIRHGDTEWTRSGRHAGRADIPLSEAGRADAQRLRARLAHFCFSRILVSPLARARETCALAGLLGRAEERSDLMEWDYGAYQGRSLKEVLAQRPSSSLWTHGAPGGETAAAVGARADRLLAELDAVDGHCALFAHGHLLRVLAARRLGLPAQRGCLFLLSPASVSVLGTEDGAPVLRLWNDVSHLQR